MADQKTVRTPEDVAERLTHLKFSKKAFGGVDEEDVWDKIDRLNEYYKQVYLYQEAHYQSLLDERNKTIRYLQQELQKSRNK
ncbi:MAG: hypothetical protein ACOYB8_11080 [Eubacteriaceae bacterium]|jgi:cell division septal protein FtsQ